MDLTEAATPFYFAAMGAEHLALKRRSRTAGPSQGDYEWRDTVASLTMGTASLYVPIVLKRVSKNFQPTRRAGRIAAAATVAGAAVTSWADHRQRRGLAAPDIAGPISAATVGAGLLTVSAAWWSFATPDWLYEHRPAAARALPRWVAWPLALVGWDFIYYWNHRLMHELRYMWSIHVVHHSSERYNLSTALRQPVADVLGTFIPQLMALFGVTPQMISTSRGVNLLYQFWIHTEVIDRIGPLERVLNTPSHHRVHHGSNPQYIDRNYGGILICWDKWFGSFEPEREPVGYGLTTNIDTFNPIRIATHDYVDLLDDAAASTSWRERLSFVFRGPGWAIQRRKERAAAISAGSALPVGTAA